MVCPSPACPPQATFTEVSDAINDSCPPSLTVSGISPMSQFKSMRFIPESTPRMPAVFPVPAAAIAPCRMSPLQIVFHHEVEVAPRDAYRRQSRLQSSDSRLWSVAPQKE